MTAIINKLFISSIFFYLLSAKNKLSNEIFVVLSASSFAKKENNWNPANRKHIVYMLSKGTQGMWSYMTYISFQFALTPKTFFASLLLCTESIFYSLTIEFCKMDGKYDAVDVLEIPKHMFYCASFSSRGKKKKSR